MKKILFALLALLLVGLLIAGCAGKDGLVQGGSEPTTEPTAEPTPEPEDEDTGIQVNHLYALHYPDDVVLNIGGKDIPWRDYFYFYYSRASQLEQQFQMYQAYGMAMGWDSEADDEGHTFAELLDKDTQDTLCQLIALETLAEENGVTLSEEDEASVQADHQDLIKARFGDEGTEEQLMEFLESIYVSPELYWRLVRFPYLYQNCSTQLYGENGDKLEEEEVIRWMEDKGVLSANHILIATVDLTTREPLDEATVAEKAALAEQIAQELQAIEDPEEREARFLELKEQYCEDGNAYVFGPGVMAQEFYDGTKALEENQVSNPVLSTYGYHIILRRPLHADDEIFSGGYSSPVSGRESAASELYNSLLEERIASLTVKPVNGFEAPNFMDYYIKPVATE